MNGATKRKPAAREGVKEEKQQDYGELTLEMGSPNRSWHPEPDDQIYGRLRHDVNLSPNETKAIAYVDACCTLDKAAGRTAWGITDRGQPLTEARIKDYFGWDDSNTSKHLKRPLAWGFLRRNEKGVFGLGGNVTGTYDEERMEGEDGTCKVCGRTLGEGEKCPVCTYRIPEYVFVAIKGLSEIRQKNFVQGWVTRKQREQKRISEQTKTIRQEELADLKKFCKGFGVDSKRTRKKTPTRARKTAGKSSRRTAPKVFHTGMYIPERKSGLYKPEKALRTKLRPTMYRAKTRRPSMNKAKQS